MRIVNVMPVIAMCTSSAAFADTALNCAFTSECMTGEICEDTNSTLSLAVAVVGKSALVDVVKATMTTDAETVTLHGVAHDGMYSLSGGAVFPASHHLTGATPGPALYTTHFSGDFGITYIGACA